MSTKPTTQLLPEEDPVAIEAAMLALARAIAREDEETPPVPLVAPHPRPRTNLGWAMRDPVRQALKQGLCNLLVTLTKLVGQTAASDINERVDAQVRKERAERWGALPERVH
ncbi:hypothetical protein [Methylobacterium sp. A54F]